MEKKYASLVFLMIAIVLINCSHSFADLTIIDNDIVDYHYIYDMNYADMEQSSSVFDADVNSQLNVETENDPYSTNHYLKCLNGYTEANFVLKFDFSESTWNPTQVQLRDKLTLFNSLGNQDCNMVTQYSTDGINYITINSAVSPAIGTSNTQTQDILIDLPTDTNAFYYRMQINALTGSFYHADNQWNRIANDSADDYFKLDFYIPKYSGGTGSQADPYIISTPYDLSSIGKYNEDWDKYFIVVNDINMASVSPEDFNLIVDGFSGTFDGQNHSISNLTLERLDTGMNDSLGLFCRLNLDATVKNVILIDPYISNTGGKTGTLAGEDLGIVKNCHVIGGYVEGTYYVGGLTGTSCYGSVFNSSSSVDVYAYVASGANAAGGISGGIFSECHLWNCYSTGNIQANNNCGGLVAMNFGADIQNCYSTAYVQGSTAGGLVAEQSNGGTTQNSFWDTEVSGQATSVAGTGLTTEQMMNVQNYIAADWDFVGIWNILDSRTYPVHRKYLSVDSDYDGDVDFYDLSSLAQYWMDGIE